MMNERARVIEKWLLLLCSGVFVTGAAIFIKGNPVALAPWIWMFYWSLFVAVLKTCVEWLRFQRECYKGKKNDYWLWLLVGLSAMSFLMFFIALAGTIHAYTRVWFW